MAFAKDPFRTENLHAAWRLTLLFTALKGRHNGHQLATLHAWGFVGNNKKFQGCCHLYNEHVDNLWMNVIFREGCQGVKD